MLKIQDLLKIQFLKKNTNVLVFFVLFSFLFGNIFGLNSQILLINSSGFLFFIFPLIIEILNFLIFCLKKQNSNTYLCLIFISIRRGFFLGIFLEAFKLGS